MDLHKKLNLLHSFLENYQIDGLCNYFLIEDPLQLILVVDKSWWNDNDDYRNPTKVKRIISNLRQEIKNFLGFEIYIGSTVKDCDTENSLNESEKKEMNIEMFDKLIYPTLKDIFNHTEYDTRVYTHESIIWKGFWLKDDKEGNTLLVGRPTEDSDTFWYTNGNFFHGYPEMFGVEYPAFFEAIARFILKEFKINVTPIL